MLAEQFDYSVNENRSNEMLICYFLNMFNVLLTRQFKMDFVCKLDVLLYF